MWFPHDIMMPGIYKPARYTDYKDKAVGSLLLTNCWDNCCGIVISSCWFSSILAVKEMVDPSYVEVKSIVSVEVKSIGNMRIE